MSGVPPARCAAAARLHEGVRIWSTASALERHDARTHTHTHFERLAASSLRTARRFEPSSGSPLMPLSGSPL